jgi:hypothetical protein
MTAFYNSVCRGLERSGDFQSFSSNLTVEHMGKVAIELPEVNI